MKSVNNFVIVGGGTAGWMTAAAILHEIPHINITLIDKEKDDAIGVGCLGILAIIVIVYTYNKKKYLFKSIYQTLRINKLLRMRIFRFLISIISRLIFKKRFF